MRYLLVAVLLSACGLEPVEETVQHVASPPVAPALACDAGCSRDDARTVTHEGVVFTLAPEDRPPFP